MRNYCFYEKALTTYLLQFYKADIVNQEIAIWFSWPGTSLDTDVYSAGECSCVDAVGGSTETIHAIFRNGGP